MGAKYEGDDEMEELLKHLNEETLQVLVAKNKRFPKALENIINRLETPTVLGIKELVHEGRIQGSDLPQSIRADVELTAKARRIVEAVKPPF